ncbi:MAG: nucleotidyltransferase domain-containing protein [Nanoarchaeota archaeon]
MKNKILELIKSIEKENNIKILLAIESGSREWGFASEDSDYDIRCIHISPTEKYLSLEEPKKQIELIKGNLDLVSWDIKKFFSLFLKSNPTVSEWLSSNIIYVNNKFDNLDKNDLLKIFENNFSKSKLQHHYISLAKQNYEKYINLPSKEVLLKKYVYILRALGCIEYIERTNKLPPLNWKESSIYLPKEVQERFERLVEVNYRGLKPSASDDAKGFSEVYLKINNSFLHTSNKLWG